MIGAAYGGDGTNTFALPDLRGRFPVHPGTSTGLSPIAPASIGGNETHTLTTNQMPAHSHSMHGELAAADKQTPQGNKITRLPFPARVGRWQLLRSERPAADRLQTSAIPNRRSHSSSRQQTSNHDCSNSTPYPARAETTFEIYSRLKEPRIISWRRLSSSFPGLVQRPTPFRRYRVRSARATDRRAWSQIRCLPRRCRRCASQIDPFPFARDQ
ncbi:hypothetical protein FBR43_14790 [Sphingomonas baiyangensis]|uniref:Phage tail collar domain-containing protein n=1 Tax=Sphingomonas baiyangensis TaxID=2572576 RepID=A0A4U1L6R7_9SPHN|nr:hypothetical protein FBR43_14790 [Sphingomonas baiyangensis]